MTNSNVRSNNSMLPSEEIVPGDVADADSLEVQNSPRESVTSVGSVMSDGSVISAESVDITEWDVKPSVDTGRRAAIEAQRKKDMQLLRIDKEHSRPCRAPVALPATARGHGKGQGKDVSKFRIENEKVSSVEIKQPYQAQEVTSNPVVNFNSNRSLYSTAAMGIFILLGLVGGIKAFIFFNQKINKNNKKTNE